MAYVSLLSKRKSTWKIMWFALDIDILSLQGIESKKMNYYGRPEKYERSYFLKNKLHWVKRSYSMFVFISQSSSVMSICSIYCYASVNSMKSACKARFLHFNVFSLTWTYTQNKSILKTMFSSDLDNGGWVSMCH